MFPDHDPNDMGPDTRHDYRTRAQHGNLFVGLLVGFAFTFVIAFGLYKAARMSGLSLPAVKTNEIR